jgi:hypothetical protein
MRFANSVVVDRQANEIRIDGVAFPYWIQPNPEIEIPPSAERRHPATLHIGLYADNLTYITGEGEVQVMHVATPEQESEWARRRAKEIVLEGLSDIIQWLARCEIDRQREDRSIGFADLVDGVTLYPSKGA